MIDELIGRAESGEEIVITRDRTPVARLIAVGRHKRRFGVDTDRFVVPDDFDAPLPDEVLDGFYG